MSTEEKTGPARIPPLDESNAMGRCPGTGQHALLEPASGFYGCAICKTPQGVILRAGNYITPSHSFGEIHREPGDMTFVITKPEQQIPILVLAAQQGLSKDMVIDLLIQAVLRGQALLARKVETHAEQPKIILTWFGKPS